MWTTPEGYEGRLEQVWFTGTHGDVGGPLGVHGVTGPLSNIPFVWLVARLEECGLPLPTAGAHRFPQDPTAPSTGQWHGNGRLLVPPELRSVVGLEKHAMLVGLMHRFEIWAEETWNQLEQQDLDQDAMPESVQSLSF